MKLLKFASPTFLFREKCHTHFREIIRGLSKVGFDGIELFSMFGLSSEEILQYCIESNIEILCDHVHYEEFSQDTNNVVKQRALLGAKFLTIDNIPKAMLPGTNLFSTLRKEIERISRICSEYGIQLLYHNHGYDLLNTIEGVPILDCILDSFDPEILQFQPDLGWISLGGGNPSHYLRKYKLRCPVIHIKDYYASAPILLESPFILGSSRGGEDHDFFEFRPAGFGVMNYPSLVPAIIDCNPKWITIDHDMSYERDDISDMGKGLEYMKFLINITV